uniref:ATP-dependent RNA helicase n=1 Tax=Elaeophora elaphi TaxID=1147741 RepID=A0A0R3RYB2_9BILA
MRRICSQFAAARTSFRLYSTAVGTSKDSAKNQPPADTHTVIYRKSERSKPADTFGTLSSFEKKLSPFKISHGPKRPNDDFKIVDGMFEEDEEDIGWTASFLRSKLKEGNKELPIITEPLAFGRKQRKKLRKRKKAEEEYEKLYGVDRSTAKVIIECAKKEYNHYEGMRYPPGDIQLASTYWVKSKYKNDWFTIYPIMRKNPSFNPDESFSWDENVSLLDPVIIENARKLGFRMPTTIQRRTFRAFKSDAHLLITAETGSGKTAAYAAPLLSALLRNVDRHAKGIVLVPTHALRMQTSLMVSKLAEGSNIKVIGGSEKWRNVELDGQEDWNILISTPSFSPEFLASFNIDYIVLDEADMLLDDSFLDNIIALLGPLKIRHSVIDKDAKGFLLQDLNNVNLVSKSLKEVGIEHTSLSGGRRIERLINELHSGTIRVIIATDVASRGLDLPHLRHIINYDFPRQLSDYVHRCGRIGRIGSLHKCLMTSFVRRAWEVKHVNSIEVSFSYN